SPGTVCAGAGTSSAAWKKARRRRGEALLLLLIAAVVIVSGGAAMPGPEVYRVRVPAKDVTKYFPAGTGLRILSPQEFESRVEAALREPVEGRMTGSPRLIRARHRARWESGVLHGRSELVIGGGPAGPVEFPLEPWTPAVLVAGA